MKLAIIGSRTFKDFELLAREADKLNPSEIISGGAQGADTLAFGYARSRGLPIKVIIPKWSDINHSGARIKVNKFGKKYDALAGMRRNTEIIAAADRVLAFHDGTSAGTWDSIQKAAAAGKPCLVIRF